MLIVDTGAISYDLDKKRCGAVGAAVDQTNIDDPGLRHTLAAFHQKLRIGVDPLYAETSLALIAERLTHHLASKPASRTRPEAGIARQLRALLDASTVRPITLTEAATQLDRSKPHLIRSFTASYGLAPHAYLVGKQMEIARKLLLDSVPA